MANPGYDRETGDLFNQAAKSLRGRYARGVERTLHLVSNILTVMTFGKDTQARLKQRKHMIALIEKFQDDLRKECYEFHPIDQKWLEKLKKKL